ncbi:hypothetical protein, partial [Acinetobacter dispersus]|uniref:hypothetical protein n=1 Tax=Acinetobacter dispersus TaxID=70348 RepID=UPI0021CD4091
FFWGVDTCVYPILFSARHFLELFLKQQILRISYLKNKDGNDYNIKLKLLKTHDTHKLWQLFLSEVKLVSDHRLYLYLDDFHRFILDLHNVDSTGETFRYPYNQTYKKHLTGLSVIGLKKFYKEFLKFTKIASSFDYLTCYLAEEYKVGTYTKNLSRYDIEKIAFSLPKKNKWTNQNLKKIKIDLNKKFGVSKLEFVELLKIIENNIEFNNIVSNEYKLEINENKLIIFCLNCMIDKRIDLDLSLEDLACIRSIQEISVPVLDGRYFSEDIHRLTKYYLDEYKSYNKYLLDNEFSYVYRNIHRTINGLEKLRQVNTLNKIHIVFKNLFVCLLKNHKDDPLDVDSRPRSLENQLQDMCKGIIFN